MHLLQMDRTVDTMVKNVDALEDAIKSPALDIPPSAKPEDAKMLRTCEPAWREYSARKRRN